MIEDVLGDPRFDATHRRVAEDAGLAAFLGVPIKPPVGPPLGVLFGYSRRRRAFAADEVTLLSAVADQISTSLEKERLDAERRRADETARQSEKLATMGELLAGVAHEPAMAGFEMSTEAQLRFARCDASHHRDEVDRLDRLE